MTFTYSGNPDTSDQDAVRFEIQDTDQSQPLISDEEIAYMLVREGSVLRAAAGCCEVIARNFARRADLTLTSGTDTVKRTYTTMASNYLAMAEKLRQRTSAAGGAPWHGGGSLARKDQLAGEADRVQPRFGRDDFTLPGEGR